MQLTLYRKTRTGNSIIGELAMNGAFFCYTLEDKDWGLKQTDTLIKAIERTTKATITIS